MIDFQDLNAVKNDFIDGKFRFPEEFKIKGIPFFYRSSSEYSMHDLIKNNIKSAMVYACRDKEAAKAVGLEKWVLLLWGFTPRNTLQPYDVRTLSPARAGAGKIVEGTEDNDIGSSVEVRITSLPGSRPIKGKIGTGADISSLHADAFKVNRDAGTVTFKCPALSQNELSMALVDQQAVKSADGGVEYRPVVELNIKINGKLLNDVKFNLNDRSEMEYPVLVGKNALLQGKFKIDPNLDESEVVINEDDIDWEMIQEAVKDVQPPETDKEKVEQIYNALKESDISFSDLVRYVRTDVTDNIMEDLDT